jgi:23S rRNA pseudouridine2605 synthase
MPRERIQKVIAAAGLASRRGGEELIRAGRVRVDGRLAIIGEQVDPEMQRVEVDGNVLPSDARPRTYLALNKPAGLVSTVRDRHAPRTVMELLPSDTPAGTRLYPVGRLDHESEGLLLFTDDGAWAHLLLHPRYGVEREYLVGVDRALSKLQKAGLREGIELEEGVARIDHLDDTTPAQVRDVMAVLEPPYPELRWYRVVLAQGWKRQIRRMFEAVGAPVRRLVRVRVGTLRLADLPAGRARRLTHNEMALLASCARSPTSVRGSRLAGGGGPEIQSRAGQDSDKHAGAHSGDTAAGGRTAPKRGSGAGAADDEE